MNAIIHVNCQQLLNTEFAQTYLFYLPGRYEASIISPELPRPHPAAPAGNVEDHQPLNLRELNLFVIQLNLQRTTKGM